MPAIVDILTFISRVNYCLMGFMPEFSADFSYFSIYELLKFHAQLHESFFYNLRAWFLDNLRLVTQAILSLRSVYDHLKYLLVIMVNN